MLYILRWGQWTFLVILMAACQYALLHCHDHPLVPHGMQFMPHKLWTYIYIYASFNWWPAAHFNLIPSILLPFFFLFSYVRAINLFSTKVDVDTHRFCFWSSKLLQYLMSFSWRLVVVDCWGLMSCFITWFYNMAWFTNWIYNSIGCEIILILQALKRYFIEALHK